MHLHSIYQNHHNQLISFGFFKKRCSIFSVDGSHHVSQVINEKLNQSFFELLASYRVEEAKVILKSDLGKKLTIEEVAEQVGYNSKSAFNTAFKKFTSHTPSAYRDS